MVTDFYFKFSYESARPNAVSSTVFFINKKELSFFSRFSSEGKMLQKTFFKERDDEEPEVVERRKRKERRNMKSKVGGERERTGDERVQEKDKRNRINQLWRRENRWNRRGVEEEEEQQVAMRKKRMNQEVVEWKKIGRGGIGSDGQEEKEQEVAKRKKEGIRGRTESGGKEERRKI